MTVVLQGEYNLAEQFAEQLNARSVERTQIQTMIDGETPDWSRTQWLQTEVQRITRQIEALGSVNLAALDELNSSRERKGFLDSQVADLNSAIETLEDAIRKIDRETRDLLQTTFDTVNGHFGELFPKLFGGGGHQAAAGFSINFTEDIERAVVDVLNKIDI